MYDDLVKLKISTTGTGPSITYSDIVPGFRAPPYIMSGKVFTYFIHDGDHRECARGVYDYSTMTFGRQTLTSTEYGDGPIDLSGSAIMFFSPSSQELNQCANFKPPKLDAFIYSVRGTGANMGISFEPAVGYGLYVTDYSAPSEERTRFRGKAVPADTWTAIMRIKPIIWKVDPAQVYRVGMGIIDDATKRHLMVCFSDNATDRRVSVIDMTDLNTLGSELAYQAIGSGEIPEWFKVVFNGVNYAFSFSPNGIYWFALTSAAIADYFTATHIGAVIETNVSAYSPLFATISYYSDGDII